MRRRNAMVALDSCWANGLVEKRDLSGCIEFADLPNDERSPAEMRLEILFRNAPFHSVESEDVIYITLPASARHAAARTSA